MTTVSVVTCFYLYPPLFFFCIFSFWHVGNVCGMCVFECWWKHIWTTVHQHVLWTAEQTVNSVGAIPTGFNLFFGGGYAVYLMRVSFGVLLEERG